ncbi:hypothetical protein H6CHR_05572 [Variovorax sp. PBL-H6]|uniref:hypothetical protein n=1 Tax=Variovorax sp. PBL-H6 TaxID=434009 RepID=UPI001316F5C3|nr:hypothetical protein [Variovorax sp. PBL-H6]VTU39709.1 hypothetical protein H6CHR_05572 [Variovorax sp. PBL-H6]
MRPVVLANPVNVHIQKDEQPVQDQPVRAAIHRLAEVKLPPPYRESDIAAILKEHHVLSVGSPSFSNCLFQGVLLAHFFGKLETGEIKPGQPAHDRPAQYLLKKSVELLQPLSVKMEATCRQYDKMLSDSPPELREGLEKELKFVQGMAARFQTLESDLLGALAHPQDFRPTRDKTCFLLFAHAMLSDAANEVQRWLDDLDGDPPGKTLPKEERTLVLSYTTKDQPRSNLFSSEPLTPADEKLYKKCVNTMFELDGMEMSMVPSFSRTGAQGVQAILHCIFHGKGLLSGAAEQPYAVHDKYYKQQHLHTHRHDCGHMQNMMRFGVIDVIAPRLMPIYLKLVDPQSNLPAQDVKKDLVVLFHMLHENVKWVTLLQTPDDKTSFLDCAREFFVREFEVVDMITLLNEVGFSIAPIEKQSSPEEKAACYEAVAQTMDSLWKEFRGRHRDDLVASGVFAKLPKFFAD